MTAKIIAALSVLVLLLGTIALDRYLEQRKEEQKAEETQLFDVDADALVDITVDQSGKDSVRLVKTDGTWRVASPVEDRADETTVRSMTSKIEELTYDKIIDENPSDPKQYGFDPYAIRVTARTQGAGEPVELLIGEKTPVGYNQYVKLGSSPRILLTASTVKSAFDRDLLSLRSKEVFRAERDKIGLIRITRGKSSKPVTLRKNGDTWVVDGQADFEPDQDKVDGLARDLANMRIREFTGENPEDLKPYGLGKPSAVIEVEWTEEAGGVATDAIEFGKKVEEKDRYFARLKSRPTVFQIDKYTYDNLNKSKDDLREKHPLKFDRFDLTELEITTPTRSYTVAKKDGLWKLTRPEEADANATVISDLLILLQDAQGKDITRKVRKESGLDSPQLELVMKEEGKSHPKLTFGNLVLRDKKDHVYVRNEGTGTTYLVEAKKIKEILRGMEDLAVRKESPAETD